MKRSRTINGKKGYPVKEVPSYVAYIKIPVDIDRETFITHCYRTGTAFVQGVDNQFESSVLISTDLIHKLVFPSKEGKLGSSVLCVTDRVYGTSKIIGVFQDADTDQEIYEENQWRTFKGNGESFTDLDVKGNTGEINLTAHSGGNKNVASNFRFLNSQNEAKLKIEVQGDFSIEADRDLKMYVQRNLEVEIEDIDNNEGDVTSIKYESGKGFTFLDEFENSISTDKNGILLGNKNGEEFSLSNKGFTYKNKKANLKSIFNDFLDSMLASIIQTPAGPGFFDPGTLAKLNKAKIDVNNLFS